MNVREATVDDVEAIRRVARESFEASYEDALGAERIERGFESWYSSETLRDELRDEARPFFVATEGGDVVAFAQSYLASRRETVGEIDWIHVTPEYRERGIGSRLLERVERELRDRGATRIEGRVLLANETGTAFYEREGYTDAGEREVDIGGETFRERLFVKFVAGDGEQVLTEARSGPDGTLRYVAFDEAVRASQGAFYPAYADRERDELHGWMCGNCESFDVAIDTMDRYECVDCGNRRKPARWDAAYL
ncbi:GNAT family acetyltransferase [Halalkaliarchaeum desulfuricum]|uniref:GNAT family acetyltransferase n=1 Tax=Halalkaliarchaeum desulfuricum TaxID=2055893 RepID=A0A343TGG5_9EURY|nr:GNAT family N-acetyltransferase [Halalkaliarchaeum desulfuricum]AUX08187.1 GNAT family acetyltransferase [Halalkaliarchaeum desulfuricum]